MAAGGVVDEHAAVDGWERVIGERDGAAVAQGEIVDKRAQPDSGATFRDVQSGAGAGIGLGRLRAEERQAFQSPDEIFGDYWRKYGITADESGV